MLRAIKVKGKEYPVDKIIKVIMEDGEVVIIYNVSFELGLVHRGKIVADFHECEFISDKDGG